MFHSTRNDTVTAMVISLDNVLFTSRVIVVDRSYDYNKVTFLLLVLQGS